MIIAKRPRRYTLAGRHCSYKRMLRRADVPLSHASISMCFCPSRHWRRGRTPQAHITNLPATRGCCSDLHERWQPREREMPQAEIMLWTTPKEPPWALLTSVCNEQLDPSRANCMIVAQRQPGKFTSLVKSATMKAPRDARMSATADFESSQLRCQRYHAFPGAARFRRTKPET